MYLKCNKNELIAVKPIILRYHQWTKKLIFVIIISVPLLNKAYFRLQHNIQLWSVPFSLWFLYFFFCVITFSESLNCISFFNFRVFTILVCLSNNRISDFFFLFLDSRFLSLGAQTGPYPWKNHTCKLTNYFSHSMYECAHRMTVWPGGDVMQREN